MSAPPWWSRPSPATAAPPRPCATPCISARWPPHCSATMTTRCCRTSCGASTRIAWLARSPTPIPETGSHFWYPVSSGAETVEGGWKVRKKASWTTSAGFADWYIVQTTSPDFSGNYSDLSCFLMMGNEVKAEPSKWDGLGLRGNQSGTLEVDNVHMPADRLVGPKGDGSHSNDEAVDPFFLLCSSACWNGISLGADRHRQAPHHHQEARRRRHARRRLPDHPGLRRRGDHRHQRLPRPSSFRWARRWTT